MTRRFSRWECPKCGGHLTLYICPSEAPTCSHIATVCRQKPARMVAIEDVSDADRAELAELVKGQSPQHAAALAKAWAEGREGRRK